MQAGFSQICFTAVGNGSAAQRIGLDYSLKTYLLRKIEIKNLTCVCQ